MMRIFIRKHPPPQDAIEFVLEEDRAKPKSEQMVFYIRALSQADCQRVLSAIGDDGGPIQPLRALASNLNLRLNACRRGVVDWNNLRDESGREIRCKRKRRKGEIILTQRSVEIIAPWAEELGAEIIRLTEIKFITQPAKILTGRV